MRLSETAVGKTRKETPIMDTAVVNGRLVKTTKRAAALARRHNVAKFRYNP